MPRVARASVALLACLAGTAGLPAGAAAASTCAYDAGSHRLSITGDADGGDTWLRRSGSRIQVRTSVPELIDCSGPDATVTNTDTIEWTDNAPSSLDRLSVFLNNGALAPGFTDEGTGNSEIEIVAHGSGAHSQVFVYDAGATDAVRAGTLGGETRVNLNPSEGVQDADIVASGLDALALYGTTGANTFDARGGAGTGSPLAAMLYSTGWYGDDTIHAGAGPSEIAGGPDDDTLIGGPSADELSPSDGDDVVDGNGGTDTITFTSTALQVTGVRLDLGDGAPQSTNEGTDTVEDIEDVVGSLGPDVLRGSAADNRLAGLNGDDVLSGEGGNDQLYGSYGNDTAGYDAAPAGVTVNLRTRTAQPTGAAGNDLLSEVENLVGSAFADSLTGDIYPNRLDGGDGGDTLSGYHGNDILAPGSSPSGGPDGADAVDGGVGVDTITYAGRTGGVAVRFGYPRNVGADPNGDGLSSPAEEGDRVHNVQNVTGGDGNDRLNAAAGVNVLLGGKGDDLIAGGAGADTLDGQDGADTVTYAGRGGRVAVRLDTVRNDGTDTDGDGVSEPGEENDLVLGIENATGGNGPDTLVATAATPTVNVLTGGPGADFLDALDGTSAVDRLVCGGAADTYRRDPSDTLSGCETAAP